MVFKEVLRGTAKRCADTHAEFFEFDRSYDILN